MEQRDIVRVLAAIAEQPTGSLAERLCAAAEQQLAGSGVGLSVTVRDDLLDPVAATTGARSGEALQAELGDGPSYTCSRTGVPVLVPDVHHDGTWPTFGDQAAALGVLSVFAFPLRRGAMRLGALTLYRGSRSELTVHHHADALIYARVGCDLLLSLQADQPVQQPSDQPILEGATDTVEIHQAAGAVSVQLGIDVGSALAVLRARAFASGQPLHDLAKDVVTRRVRMDE